MNDLFYKKIENSTAHRAVRDSIAYEVLKTEDLFLDLIRFAFDVNDKNHHKSFWILELVCFQNLKLINNHLDFFCSNIKNLKNESALRPASKICQLLVFSHYKKKEIQLAEEQLQVLIENNFDWLINDTKVASKAYAMRTLFVLGKHYEWIHPELKTIITKDFPNHSYAYKTVAKEVLKKIK